VTSELPDLTIRKVLHVHAPVERAFDVFTTGMPGWWPVATHSIASGVLSISWEVGGIAVETVAGARHEWFDVVEFDPPHVVAMRWRVTPESPVTSLRVSFEAEGDDTRVELTHTGWESFGADAARSFGGYEGGWDVVLGQYVRALGPSAV
jgi:uncharacterized protein YndB with AHSA1/START domain